ncbi:50S ribosomal protein L28 [Glycomyces harbinensis]|uniref:Large ribosomal subunit protein bL28 n=1 Tax=Glycomyces harbinensis TaxID=58114 RepID=A0A1G7DIY8_9ACTN|nr:50S ribosomal protein L28 [Glycomyces harbinensis]SDE50725.1 large subunit ribosomal protein L28 [Glycomyces harbinensis]
MSRTCEVTGAGPGFGNNVPWSKKKTRRRWNVNLQSKRYYLASEGRHVRLRVSAKGIKIIDRDGVEAVVARMRAEGKRV